MNEWHYEQNDQAIGPVPESQLVAAYESGQIAADTLVWNPSMSDWEPLSESSLAVVAPEKARIQSFWSYETSGDVVKGVTADRVKHAYLKGQIDEYTLVLPPRQRQWVRLDATELFPRIQKVKDPKQNKYINSMLLCTCITLIGMGILLVSSSFGAAFFFGLTVFLSWIGGVINATAACFYELFGKPNASRFNIFAALIFGLGHIVFVYALLVEFRLGI